MKLTLVAKVPLHHLLLRQSAATKLVPPMLTVPTPLTSATTRHSWVRQQARFVGSLTTSTRRPVPPPRAVCSTPLQRKPRVVNLPSQQSYHKLVQRIG